MIQHFPIIKGDVFVNVLMLAEEKQLIKYAVK